MVSLSSQVIGQTLSYIDVIYVYSGLLLVAVKLIPRLTGVYVIIDVITSSFF